MANWKGYREAAGAILIGVGLILLLALAASIAGCATWIEKYPTEVRMFAAWDTNRTSATSPIGTQPTGHIFLTQPLPAYMEVSFQHVSSIPQYYDRGEMNSLGVGFCVKVPLRKCR